MLRVVITGGVIFGVSYFLPSLIRVADFQAALLAALVLAIANAVIRPVVVVLSLPITILTLGLFALVINALMLYLVAAVVGPGFQLQGFWQTIVAAVLISVVSAAVSSRLVD
ncbi:MAG: phage holin family protein [Actinomycetota bacterium]|nr:phage holin family protein [Actinomycetota bacterium]